MRPASPTDWQTKPLPEQHVTIPLDRFFTREEMDIIGRGLIPQQMEDKWFIYWEDDELFLHRSWTGNCIYQVRFEPDGDGSRMVEAKVNRDPKEYIETDDGNDGQLISYLIDLLLLRRPAPFPSRGSSPEQSALAQWSTVGRASLGEHPRDPS